MKLSYLSLVTIFLLNGFGASAGGWVSSGGEVFQDETNPWFLSNVSDVKYCVTTGLSFSMPQAQVQGLVKSSIEYWKSEFSRASRQSLAIGEFAVATQTFTEVACGTGAVDIQFQFGFETLTPEQKTYLQDPTKYIGVAVRTEYDPVQIRGKGFVYVASDTGPNAYRNNGTLITTAWANPKLLQYVILHELGHIFGLPHAGGGLMSQTFLEQILNLKLYQIFSKIEVESYLSPNDKIKMCDGVDLNTRQWFGATPQTACITLTQNGSGGYEVTGDAEVKLGTLKTLVPNAFDLRSKPAIVLNLPEEQKVFSVQQTNFRNFMNGPMTIDFGGTSTFIPANGTAPKSAYLRVSPTSLAVFGSAGPMLKPVFLYNSLLATTLMVSTQGNKK